MSHWSSPISRLPLEVLTSIFLECAPPPSREDPGPPLSSHHPASVLTQVCHGWRQLALETAQLWARMHIQTPSTSDFSLVEDWCAAANRLATMIEKWMGRSGQRPLAIMLDLQGFDFAQSKENERLASTTYPVVASAIFKCSKRWHQVFVLIDCRSVYAPMDSFMEACQDLSADSFPILRSLSIETIPSHRSIGEINDSTSAIVQSGLFSGRMLHCVKLAGYWNMSTLLTTPIQGLSQLTEIEVKLSSKTGDHGDGYFNPYHIFYLLDASPCLRKASFLLSTERQQSSGGRAAVITHRNLEALHLWGMPVGPNFAKTLDLPSLKVLSLIFDANPGGHPTPHWHTGVLNLLSKFGNQLTALALNPIVLTPSSFQSCLNSLNNERLEFLGLFEKHFPSSKALPSAVENGVGDYFDWPVLIRLTTPGAFPCLKLLEMEVRNMVADNDVSIGGTRLELEVVELIAVRAVKADATGSSAENVGESTFAGEFKRKKGDCTTAGMHIAFTRASNINIVEALEDRGIDLRSRSLQMRLVYPNATISHGSLPVSPWGH